MGSTKTFIWLGILIGGFIGGGIGNLLDHQSFFSLSNMGGWTIIMTGIGSIAGILLGYKLSKNLS